MAKGVGSASVAASADENVGSSTRPPAEKLDGTTPSGAALAGSRSAALTGAGSAGSAALTGTGSAVSAAFVGSAGAASGAASASAASLGMAADCSSGTGVGAPPSPIRAALLLAALATGSAGSADRVATFSSVTAAFCGTICASTSLRKGTRDASP